MTDPSRAQLAGEAPSPTVPAPIGPWSRRRFLATAVGGAAAVALAACSDDGLARSSSPDPSQLGDQWGGELVDPPIERPDLVMTDLDGNDYPLRERTEGKLAVLFLGYTSCPDVCPIYLNTMAAALESIGTGPGSDPLVLFVGVDTKRDTPEKMREYLGRLDPSFVGLTGTPERIGELNSALFLPDVTFEEPDADGDYLVGHSSRAFAFTPDGVAHRIYNYDVRQQTWVRDLPRLAEGEYR